LFRLTLTEYKDYLEDSESDERDDYLLKDLKNEGQKSRFEKRFGVKKIENQLKIEFNLNISLDLPNLSTIDNQKFEKKIHILIIFCLNICLYIFIYLCF
jgi:hypothetical protein